MNKYLAAITCMLILWACKNKKKNENEKFFSTVSYIQSQVKHVDTSLFKIVRIETVNGISDTSYIKRENFRDVAKDFLTIPDIASDKWSDNYDESNTYDEMLKNAVLTYTSKEKDNEIQREVVMIDPDDAGNSTVRTIIIDKIENGKDSTIEKNMIWHVDRRFQVITKIHKPDKAELIKTLQVSWNDFSNN